MKCEKSRTSGYKAITKNDLMTLESLPSAVFRAIDRSQGRILLMNYLLDGEANALPPLPNIFEPVTFCGNTKPVTN